MDKQFIKDCLRKRTTRTEAVNNSIAKYINHSSVKSNCMISNECKIKMQRKCISIDNMMPAIENIQKLCGRKI